MLVKKSFEDVVRSSGLSPKLVDAFLRQDLSYAQELYDKGQISEENLRRGVRDAVPLRYHLDNAMMQVLLAHEN